MFVLVAAKVRIFSLIDLSKMKTSLMKGGDCREYPSVAQGLYLIPFYIPMQSEMRFR